MFSTEPEEVPDTTCWPSRGPALGLQTLVWALSTRRGPLTIPKPL